MRLPGVRDLHGKTGKWSLDVVAPNDLETTLSVTYSLVLLEAVL